MDPAADTLRMLRSHPCRESIVLPSGQRVDSLPGVADSKDTLVGQAVVAGLTPSLTCAALEGVTALVPTSDWVLRASGKKYRISEMAFIHRGTAIKLFLGDEVTP